MAATQKPGSIIAHLTIWELYFKEPTPLQNGVNRRLRRGLKPTFFGQWL